MRLARGMFILYLTVVIGGTLYFMAAGLLGR